MLGRVGRTPAQPMHPPLLALAKAEPDRSSTLLILEAPLKPLLTRNGVRQLNRPVHTVPPSRSLISRHAAPLLLA